MTTAELEEIRAADAGMGPGPESLQFYPPCYTHRRQLLEHIAALETELRHLYSTLGAEAPT